MSKTSSHFWKWVGGIVGTIITGVVVWWLTHSGGPLNPIKPPVEPEEPKPRVVITEFHVDEPVIIPPDKTTKATITVYNENNITASQCKILWSSHGKNFSPIEMHDFGLPPNKSKTLIINSGIYRETGLYKSFVYVKCKNCTSDTVDKDISVIRAPIPPSPSEHSITSGELIGGTGGNPFNDSPKIPPRAKIKKLTVYCGAYVRGIETTWKYTLGFYTGEKTSGIHGGQGGANTLVFRDNEYIASVSGFYGLYPNNSSVIVGKLKITTNLGRILECGSQGGTQFVYKAPPDSVVMGFLGRAGTLMDAIGVIVRKRS